MSNDVHVSFFQVGLFVFLFCAQRVWAFTFYCGQSALDVGPLPPRCASSRRNLVAFVPPQEWVEVGDSAAAAAAAAGLTQHACAHHPLQLRRALLGESQWSYSTQCDGTAHEEWGESSAVAWSAG